MRSSSLSNCSWNRVNKAQKNSIKLLTETLHCVDEGLLSKCSMELPFLAGNTGQKDVWGILDDEVITEYFFLLPRPIDTAEDLVVVLLTPRRDLSCGM